MRSILEQLDGHDAVLLMYLADELPGEDRARVDQMLNGDEAMRARLEELRAAHDTTGAAMRDYDASHPLTGSEAAAVRHVGRMIRNWHADRVSRPAARSVASPRTLRFPYWSYPLAAAAAVTLAFVTWYVTLPEPGKLAGDATVSAEVVSPESATTAESVDLSSDATRFALSDSSSGLSEVESELRLLQLARENMQ
jgi:anti-sigma factor RsiW